MTAQELHINFRLFFDDVNDQSLPDFLGEEIDILLNEAQIRYVKSQYDEFQKTQRITDSIRSIVGTFNLKRVTGFTDRFDLGVLYTNEAQTVDSTKKYWYNLRTVPKIAYTPIGSSIVYTKYVDNCYLARIDYLSKFSSDPFNKSKYDYPILYFEGTSLVIVTDNTFTCDNIKITCIFEPRKISLGSNQTSDLPAVVHSEIVQLAVAIGLESVESKRLQNNYQILKDK
jgi:hypothetical protein